MADDASKAAWAALMALAARPNAGAIRPLFAADPNRFARYSRQAGDILLDFSKTALSDDVLAALLALAEARDVAGFRARLFAGAAVNATEGRSALHMALRAEPDDAFRAGSEDIMPGMIAVRARMEAFTRAVHEGRMLTAKGERYTDVLNIGIGGSDLGPAMVARALSTDKAPLRGHYLANVDGHAWAETQARLDPARTLVLVASKTFTTQETMANAALARDWLRAALGEAGATQHMAALSTNLAATSAFGISPDRVFGFRDWVGGRFSLWSAIGLSLALTLGWDAFARLLAGARVMDQHFRDAPLAENLPVLLALVEAWHVNGLGYPSRAVLPYDERLARLPAHLQQLEMESLGKRIAVSGAPLQRASGPVVFGEPGTNAQHSFMQLLHQGTTPVPVDFILVARPDHAHADSHRKLLANGLAQAEALLMGKDEAAITAEMRAAGVHEADIARLLPHRIFPGDRPSVTMLLPRLDAFTLGQLVALYEHKVAVLGALWGINPFDQFGVELGKQLASAILPELGAGAPQRPHDASTAALIGRIAALWPEGRA
ncbi:MAG: glucose-6-phosphate isomerase [Alphaproteobacteria bacterium]|nr:glucose-6-phosphate isomerase [Alphaproteobacteria bacterium]